jgi:hypothetical protein
MLEDRLRIREGGMPTRPKPQLNHNSVKYSEIFERFHKELLADQNVILERVGFSTEFADPSNPAWREAAAELISEIAALLATALIIRLDAGYKAAWKVIATLEAIIKNPKLALSDRTEPEARGALAAAYQRSDEPPRTYWFDIYGESGFAPDDNQIRMAAKEAIASLRAQASRGRPVACDVHFLAFRLRAIFLQFNDKIARNSVLSSHGDGDYFQSEQGAFFAFVEEVLKPLRKFYASLPTNGEVLVPELSSEYMARLAVSTKEGTPIQVYNFRRAEKGKLLITALQKGAQNSQNSGLRLLRSASFWRVMEAQRLTQGSREQS